MKNITRKHLNNPALVDLVGDAQSGKMPDGIKCAHAPASPACMHLCLLLLTWIAIDALSTVLFLHRVVGTYICLCFSHLRGSQLQYMALQPFCRRLWVWLPIVVGIYLSRVASMMQAEVAGVKTSVRRFPEY